MAVNPPQDPLARERRRKRREQQIRRRRLALAACLLGLIILIVGLAVGLSGGDDGTTETTSTEVNGDETTTVSLTAATFTAELTGAESVPPVETQSTGTFNMEYDPEAETLSYSLTLHGLSNPSSAAIYEGAAGSTGTAVYVLFAGPAETVTAYEGELVSGVIEPSRLTGSLEGGTVADLISLIQSGGAYVSVGNTSHPVDAIRGPIN